MTETRKSRLTAGVFSSTTDLWATPQAFFDELDREFHFTLDVAALPEKDQNLYAEITYSWLTTRINEIKKTNEVDFLFCVLTDKEYQEQFFLFSGADEGAVRGRHYEQVYPLGHVVSVADNAYQQEAMRSAVRNSAHLISSGKYADYYAYNGEIDGEYMLTGMTYNLTALTEDIDDRTWQATLWAVAYQVGLSVLFLTGIFLFVLTPLRTVQQNIRLYAETNTVTFTDLREYTK
jgi:hypothetical protein